MWKYKSQNIDYVSLHDHLINKILFEEHDILLIFEDGFSIQKEHPLNDTGTSKHTTSAQIILRNAAFLQGIVCRENFGEPVSEQERLDFATLKKAFIGVEVFEFELEGGAFSIVGNLWYTNESKRLQEYVEMEFSCDDVLFCWNDYSSDAWFEGWPKNQLF